MANRWENNGSNDKALFSWAPKSLQMAAAAMKLKDACSMEEKLWQTLDSILKSRDIPLLTKVPIITAVTIVPVVMSVRVGPQRKLSAKELMVLNYGVGEDPWESFPWTARRSNLSVLKDINPEYSLEGLMLELKFQYIGHLIRKHFLEKTLMLGKMRGRRRRGRQRMRWLDSITDLMDMS